MAKIEIFRTGTHTAMDNVARTFTDADLQAIAAGYSQAAYNAPVVVGHPKGDAPAYGWIKGLSVDGDRLVAELDEVDEGFAELVRKGRFKNVSSAFFQPEEAFNPKPGQWSLRHVGFLGAQPPAIYGLKKVEFSADAPGVAFMMPWQQSVVARLFRAFREYLIGTAGQEVADRVMPSFDIDSIAELPPEPFVAVPAPAFSAPPSPDPQENPLTKTQAELDADKAKLDADRATLKADQDKLAAQQVAFSQAEAKRRGEADVTFVDKLVAEGRLLPANKADTLAMLAALPADAAAPRVAFSQGGERSPHQAMRDLLAKQPIAVAFGQRVQGGDTGADPRSAADIRRRAQDEIDKAAKEGRTLSIPDALNLVTAGA